MKPILMSVGARTAVEVCARVTPGEQVVESTIVADGRVILERGRVAVD